MAPPRKAQSEKKAIRTKKTAAPADPDSKSWNAADKKQSDDKQLEKNCQKEVRPRQTGDGRTKGEFCEISERIVRHWHQRDSEPIRDWSEGIRSRWRHTGGIRQKHGQKPVQRRDMLGQQPSDTERWRRRGLHPRKSRERSGTHQQVYLHPGTHGKHNRRLLADDSPGKRREHCHVVPDDRTGQRKVPAILAVAGGQLTRIFWNCDQESGSGHEKRHGNHHFKPGSGPGQRQNHFETPPVEDIARASGQPTVVHCSAGVGRTGTVVALEVCLQTLLSGKSLSVLKVVQDLRAMRMHCVQTDLQLVFICKCLAAFAASRQLISGDLTTKQDKFDTDYSKLIQERAQPENDVGYTPLVPVFGFGGAAAAPAATPPAGPTSPVPAVPVPVGGFFLAMNAPTPAPQTQEANKDE
uniref:Uncharacterized protein n=1 Tax=Panagrolaimus sp. JU765 TaxID=591449 RepID=A0AC34QJW1_9BILA